MSSEWSLDSVPVHQSQRTVHGWIDGYRGDASPTTSYPSTFDNSVWHNQNLSSSQVKVCSDRIEQIDKCRHSIRVLLKSELVPMNYSTVRQVIAQSGAQFQIFSNIQATLRWVCSFEPLAYPPLYRSEWPLSLKSIRKNSLKNITEVISFKFLNFG
jgi:hypothetical protein